MMQDLLKLSFATIAFGASSAALALTVAMTGLWLIGLATGNDTGAIHIAAVR